VKPLRQPVAIILRLKYRTCGAPMRPHLKDMMSR
jgi:hypothetical protein